MEKEILNISFKSKSLNQQWVVGFVDGEEGLCVSISRNPSMKNKHQAFAEFVVVQQVKDISVYNLCREKFGYGVVRKNHRNGLCYRVRSFSDLQKIIRPFYTYTPIGPKKIKKGFTFVKSLTL